MRSTIDQTLLSARETAGPARGQARHALRLCQPRACCARSRSRAAASGTTTPTRSSAFAPAAARCARRAARDADPGHRLGDLPDRGRPVSITAASTRSASPTPRRSKRWRRCCGAMGGRKKAPCHRGEGWGEGAARPEPRPATLTRLAASLGDPRRGCGERPPDFIGRPRREYGRVRAGGSDRTTPMRLAALSATDLAALDLTRAGVVRTGRAILAELAACVGRMEPRNTPLHHQLAASWQLDEAGTDLVRRCLVLLADHELNASTFVARCVASTGATPYAVVSAALAALSGRRHGGASARAEALFQIEIQSWRTAEPMAAMAARLARDESLPGWGSRSTPMATRAPPRSSLPPRRGAGACRVDRPRCRGRDAADRAIPQRRFRVSPPRRRCSACRAARRSGCFWWRARSAGSRMRSSNTKARVLIRPRARYTGRRPAALG